MPEELKAGDVVYQLAYHDTGDVAEDGRLKLFVKDKNGQATIQILIDRQDFERQFRTWSGFKNVFVRAVTIIAIEKEGRRIRFKRLDKQNQPIGDEQIARNEEFSKAFLLEHQISI